MSEMIIAITDVLSTFNQMQFSNELTPELSFLFTLIVSFDLAISESPRLKGSNLYFHSFLAELLVFCFGLSKGS